MMTVFSWYLILFTMIHTVLTVKHLQAYPLLIIAGWMVLCALQWVLVIFIIKRRRRHADKFGIC